jgi:two-component system response regulator MtrA
VASPRVLLVEDDASLSEVVALILSAAGMDVVATGDGNEAVELARKSDFDLVVLDLMLPGRDGFEVCEAIRSWSAVPIIMLTARSEAGAIVRGLECGADDYVTKPFEPLDLVDRVNRLLNA